MRSVAFAVLGLLAINRATQDWKLGLVLDGSGEEPYDVGMENFNKLFWESPKKIIKRECPDCTSDDHKVIYYRRYGTQRTNFNVYGNMKEWFDTDNKLGVDFNIYSNLDDALSDNKPFAWHYCSYNHPGVGAFGSCAPSSFTEHQFASKSLQSKRAEFYIYVHNMDTTLRYFSTSKGFHSWEEALQWCEDHEGSLATFQSPRDIREIIDTCQYATDPYCYTGWRAEDALTLTPHFEFVNGKDFDDFGLWAKGFPTLLHTEGQMKWGCGTVKGADTQTVIRDAVCEGWMGLMAPVCEYDNYKELGFCCTSAGNSPQWSKKCPRFDTRKECQAPKASSGDDECSWVQCNSIGYCDWKERGSDNAALTRECGKITDAATCESTAFRNNAGKRSYCDWTMGNPPDQFMDDMNEYYENQKYYDDLDAAIENARNAYFDKMEQFDDSDMNASEELDDAVAGDVVEYGLDAQVLSFGDLTFSGRQIEETEYQIHIITISLMILLGGLIGAIYWYKRNAVKIETIDFDEYYDGV